MNGLERNELKQCFSKINIFKQSDWQQGDSLDSSLFRMVESLNLRDCEENIIFKIKKEVGGKYKKSNILNAPRLRPLELEEDNLPPFSLPMAAIEL